MMNTEAGIRDGLSSVLNTEVQYSSWKSRSIQVGREIIVGEEKIALGL